MTSVSRVSAGLTIAVICATLASCVAASEETFTIRVSGPPQTEFTGQCSAIESDQTTNSVDLEGFLTPEQDTVEFETFGEHIYCALYAQELDGTLRLELLRDSEMLDSAQTSVPFADVTVEYPAWGILEGQVTIGPLVPVSREGVPDPTPAPEVYAAREIVIYAEDGQTEVARAQITPSDDYRGGYRIPLPVGTYVVDINRIGVDRGANLPSTVEIVADQVTTLDIDIDTGIR